MMIAFITFKSSLVPLLEGLWSSNSWEFELSGFWRNRTDDLGIDSPSLWPIEPRLHVRSDKWNGSSGQTPCPCPTCPTKIWRPPSPCSTCPTKIWRPPSPYPTNPTTPTWPNVSHLVVPLVLCQLSFLRFFQVWISQCHSIFRKTLLDEKFSSKYYHVGESINDKQISTKRHETTVTIHSNTCVYFL